jgi:hypothetical protein
LRLTSPHCRAQQDRGDAFEVFAEAYLATQKLVGAEEVWPADQVPIAVLQACCLPVHDLGADGVYKMWGGQYNAYQSKFRTCRPALTWEELSTFVGLTDQVGERVLFTTVTTSLRLWMTAAASSAFAGPISALCGLLIADDLSFVDGQEVDRSNALQLPF